ncbi:ABC transporter ATP-binding protein [Neobacillus drentensis]|uniref:ABC transporter ATP-binding protein n=1 Tax=Neobacillus drentensis TaxID=220684 RepID=UPI002FFE200B
MRERIVQLKAINKFYGKNHIVKDLTLDVHKEEFLTLLGPSGCGKTTTLRMIGGFEVPDAGEVYLNGIDVSKYPPYKRNVNTVFQNYALFPHMTVSQNVGYGLKMKGIPKDDRESRVNKILKLVQMENFSARKPREMSGGQQQRIAVARAIVNNPSVLLLDEPLGALDLKLRKEMQLELKHLQQSLGITFIYVTHDQEEALTMSDRIAVMYDGSIAQLDTPEEIYYHPKTAFVADFIGETNMLKGKVSNIQGDQAIIDLFGHKFPVDHKQEFSLEGEVNVSIRPETLVVSEDEALLSGTVKEMIFVGSNRKVVLELSGGQELTLMIQEGTSYFPGQEVGVAWRRQPVVLC